MMKKAMNVILAGAITFTMILAASGCGNSGGSASASSKASTAAASSAASTASSAASTASSVASAASSVASSAASSAAGSSAAQTDGKFSSPDGWNVEYNPSLIEVNKIDDHTQSFVYTGECAGSCLVTISYKEGKKPADVVAEVTKDWGADGNKLNKSESTLPGSDNKKALYYELPADGGSNLSSTIIAGEYKNGTLSFEVTFHKADKEDMDMKVSDTLAAIIDSVTYK